MNPLADAIVEPLKYRCDAVLLLADGSEVSGEQLYEMSGRIANVLTAAGTMPGDRVAMQCEKSPQALALYLACLRVGALILPLNTAYTPSELDYFLGDATARVAVCDPSGAQALEDICTKHGTHLFTMDGAGEGTLHASAVAAKSMFVNAERAPDDLAAILYTSGTTGRSKGAMLSHDNLLSNTDTLAEIWQFTKDDTLLHALPIFHTHGLFVATNIMLRAGGRMIFLPKFDAAVVLDMLPQATAMMGVPTFYTRLLAESRFDSPLTSHMRLFISGSAPLLAETHVAFENRTGHKILERYGMTETTMSTSNPYNGDRRAGTVGRPLPGVEARIVDADSGSQVPTGETGVLEVRGPNVFKGYWQMPEKTADEFREDGFFITGDLAQKSDDGYITIVGRSKDLIITGGFNVYPKEVESLIDEMDGVLESAVFGVEHPDFGEGVVAAVVMQNGVAPDAESIRAALAKKLAKFKQPKKLLFVEALPRNTMGKVQKNILRTENAGLFGG